MLKKKFRKIFFVVYFLLCFSGLTLQHTLEMVKTYKTFFLTPVYIDGNKL